MRFSQNWDIEIVGQWMLTQNDMAVITAYPSDLPALKNGAIVSGTRPVMCRSHFENGIVRHLAQPEAISARSTPILQPFWAAGFSFSRGHFIVNVPYDCCTLHVFQGEEINIAVRAWTHGYDFYAPMRSILVHDYSLTPSRGRPLFEENAYDDDVKRRSMARIRATIGLTNESELIASEPYGIGRTRSVDDFFDISTVSSM